jgi:hypothetical protein
MDVVAEISPSAASWPMVVPAWHSPVILRVNKLRPQLLHHGLPLLILQFEVLYVLLNEQNCLIMAHRARACLALSNNAHNLSSLAYINGVKIRVRKLYI